MPGLYDMHCHLLYGVDDGPETIEQSLALLGMEYDDGVRTIFLTPHYRRGMFECPREVIAEHFAQLKKRAKPLFPDLRLILGCEVHVHSDLVQQLRSGSCAPLGDTDYVLLEFSEYADSRSLMSSCMEAINGGFRPILAHAERCAAIRKDLELLRRLVELGVRIQMNADSILGENGLRWKRFCRKAMKHDLLHYIGSDAHDPDSRRPNLGACAAHVERVMGPAYRDKIMKINPQEIEEGSA